MGPKKKEGKSKAKKKGKSEVSPEERERLDLLEKACHCTVEASAEKELCEQFNRQSEQLKQYWECEKSEKLVSVSLSSQRRIASYLSNAE